MNDANDTLGQSIFRAAVETEVAAAVEQERASIALWLVSQPVTLKMLGLSGLAKCIARGDHARPAAARPTLAQLDENFQQAPDDSGLPEHRDHDDFEEGKFLVQGQRFRAGVTGRLRDK